MFLSVLYIGNVKMERMGNKNYKSTFFLFLFIFIGLSAFANNTQGDPITKTTELSLEIYPNPTSSVTNIIVKGSDQADIFILNSLGKLIREVKMTNELTSLSVDDLNSGLYIIKIKDQNSDEVVSKRLLVKR